MKRTLLIIIAVAAVILGFAVVRNWGLISMLVIGPRMGSITESWQTSAQTFQLRVDERAEENSFVPGAYYVFRSAPNGSDVWRDVMTFRHDDPVPIPSENVRFVNDRIAFVFMGWMYAVTIDAGKDWSVWDAGNDLPNWQCCNYGLIEDVRLEPDGTGTMTLSPIRDRRGEVPQLRTTDYGRHWSL